MDKSLKTRDLRQIAIFDASPKELYDMIMDSKKHAAFSGAAARISSKVGGRFTAWDGWITGKNIKLVPNKIIVQEWRGEDWPKKHYSVATFKFEKKGRRTKLTFTQKRIPADKFKDISKGWKEFYWSKMKEYIER